MSHISLEVLDADGAVRNAAEDAGIARGDLLKKGALGFVAGGVLFSGLASPAAAAISTKNKSARNDVKILNYALTLEYLEAAFYEAALAKPGLITDPKVLKFAQVTGQHEADHVRTLRSVLGRARVAEPDFNFDSALTDQATFLTTAQVLEDTGVSAYAGQGPNVAQKAVVVAALSIHSVEARHAAWVRFLIGGGEGEDSTLPAPVAFDKAKTEKAVLKAVTGTGFIQ